MLGSADAFLFEGFRLESGGLYRLGETGVATPVALGSRALDLLGLLVRRRGELVSKDEIMAAVWSRTVVEENNLTVQIAALRRVLDAGRVQGSCIQTVPGRGYRFAVPVTRIGPEASRSTRSPEDIVLGPIAGEEHALGLGAPPEINARPAPISRHWCLSGMLGAIFCALVLLPLLVVSLAPHLLWREQGSSAPRLSIAVLPFITLSDNREQQYFADGITDDLTTDLSRVALMLVISRDTAFAYRGRRMDARQIGRELGVRYLLEGSVRRSDNRVRVNASLIDAETRAYLWTERFDQDIGDLTTLQDAITRRTARAVDSEIVIAEASRASQHPDALDYFFRARAAGFKPPTRETYAEMISLFERALALDPGSAEIQSWLARTLLVRVFEDLTDGIRSDIERAEGLIEQALMVSPRSPSVHHARGHLLRARGRFEEAIAEYETEIALDRNSAQAYAHLGRTKLLAGAIQETIPLQEQAIRLSPRDPNIGNWYYRIGLVHLLQSRTEEAIVWLEKARNAGPGVPYVHGHLAAAYALMGDNRRAAEALAEARRLAPSLYSSIARLKKWAPRVAPTVAESYESTFYSGLRKAGMAEE
jgi:TolB-like protein/DNA-binding winged helix-turn-helix (wHTH) protein